MTIRIGIVGANATRGWARDAHLDALRSLPQFTIAAVSARSQELADTAAAHFGAARAFGTSLDLVQDPGVDLILVSVKVPEHHAMVMAALAAGKHVYCEWPLGRDLTEAEEMARAVPEGVRAICGLQGLVAPAIRHSAALIREGRIGRPRILRCFGSAAGWGTSAPAHYAYLQDKRNGATLETIGAGHTLPLIEELAGAYVEVDARNSILHPEVKVTGTGESVARTCADHMFVLGKHESGCISTFEMIGGSPDRPALFDIEGEAGWLRITGKVPGTAQIAPLGMEASFDLPPIPAPVSPALKGAPANVAEVWASLHADLQSNGRATPDFNRAVRLTRLLDAIDTASSKGQRQRIAP